MTASHEHAAGLGTPSCKFLRRDASGRCYPKNSLRSRRYSAISAISATLDLRISKTRRSWPHRAWRTDVARHRPQGSLLAGWSGHLGTPEHGLDAARNQGAQAAYFDRHMRDPSAPVTHAASFQGRNGASDVIGTCMRELLCRGTVPCRSPLIRRRLERNGHGVRRPENRVRQTPAGVAGFVAIAWHLVAEWTFKLFAQR